MSRTLLVGPVDSHIREGRMPAVHSISLSAAGSHQDKDQVELFLKMELNGPFRDTGPHGSRMSGVETSLVAVSKEV